VRNPSIGFGHQAVMNMKKIKWALGGSAMFCGDECQGNRISAPTQRHCDRGLGRKRPQSFGQQSM